MHSDLDATRRLGELKSEFVESPPISISIHHLHQVDIVTVQLVNCDNRSCIGLGSIEYRSVTSRKFYF